MEHTDALNSIVKVLQYSLKGQLKQDSIINPLKIAESIIDKVEFSSSFSENINKELYITIYELKQEMEKELIEIKEENNKLLNNFIRGQITAFEKILNILKKK